MAATVNFSLFDSGTRSLTRSISNTVARGVTGSLDIAARSGASGAGASIASTLSDGVQRAASSFAVGVGEAVGTGRQVVGNAVDAAAEKAGSILQSAVGKIGEWQSFLTQNILGGLSGVLGRFVTGLGTVLGSAPGKIIGFLTSLFSGAGGGSGGLVSRITGFFTRNRVTATGPGRNESGGLLGNLWTRIREGVAGLAHHIADGFRAVGDFVRGAFGMAWSAVRGLAQTTVQAVASAIQAAVSAVGQALMGAMAAVPELIPVVIVGVVTIGAAISQAITRVVIRIGSAIGNALSSAWSALTAFASRAVAFASQAWSVVSPLISRFFGFMGRMFVAAWTWLQNAWKAISGALGNVASGAGGIFARAGSFMAGMFQSIVSGVKTFLGNLLAFIGGALQIGVATVAIGLFSKALFEAAKSAMEFSKNAAQLRGTTGLSYGQSASLLRSFSAFGIGGEAVNGAFGSQNPSIFKMKAGFWGLPGYENPNFIPALAGRYQGMMNQGMIGQIMARAMMKSLGMENPQFAAMAMISPRKIQGQLAYSENINARLGMTPSVIQKMAEDIPLRLGRIGIALSALRDKFLTAALPVFERLLDIVINFASVHADEIGVWLEKVVTWVTTVAPVMLAQGLTTVTSIIANGLNNLVGWLTTTSKAIADFGQWLAQSLPKWLGAAVKSVAGVLTWLADGIHKLAPIVIGGIAKIMRGVGETIAGWLDGFGEFLMDMTTNSKNPLRRLAMQLGFFFESIKLGIANLMDTLGRSPGVRLMLGYSVGNSMIQAASDMKGSASITDSIAKFFRNNPTLQSWSGSMHDGADWMRDFTERMAKNTEKYGMMGANSIEKQLRAWSNGLAPTGQINVGERFGNWLGGQVSYGANELSGLTKGGANVLAQHIQPPANALATAAQTFQQLVDNEVRRTEQRSENQRGPKLTEYQRRMLENSARLALLMQKNNIALWEGNADRKTMANFQKVAGRLGSYLTEDASLNMTRVQG